MATGGAPPDQPSGGGLALAFAADGEQRAERALLSERLVDDGEVVVRGSGESSQPLTAPNAEGRSCETGSGGSPRPHYEDLGPALPALTSTSREAILQPPRPQIQPSARIPERAADLDVDIEAVG